MKAKNINDIGLPVRLLVLFAFIVDLSYFHHIVLSCEARVSCRVFCINSRFIYFLHRFQYAIQSNTFYLCARKIDLWKIHSLCACNHNANDLLNISLLYIKIESNGLQNPRKSIVQCLHSLAKYVHCASQKQNLSIYFAVQILKPNDIK